MATAADIPSVNRLYPSQNRINTNHAITKYRLSCQEKINHTKDTKDWLELLEKIDHTSMEYKLFIGLLEKKHSIVVKIGPASLEVEYTIAKQLEKMHIPTFIEYYCMFHCLENLNRLTVGSKYLCKDSGNDVTILVMPNINLGTIDKYPWDRHTFNVLKNIIKHVIGTLLYTYNKIGFIHKDLHLGNILLKKTTRKEISYGEFGTLECIGYIPIIMDYDKSLIQNNTYYMVYDDLRLMISNIHGSMATIRIHSANIMQKLVHNYKHNAVITPIILHELWKEVDAFTIDYLVSEIPPMPNFLKPKKV